MTATTLSVPGERSSLFGKLRQIDWGFCSVLALIALAGGVMLYSIAGMSWSPWAANHLIRFGFFFVVMIVLAMVDLRIWFGLAYPVYALGLVLLIGVALFGEISLGAQRWLTLPGIGRFQPSPMT